VKVAVAIARIERFNRYGNQEIAKPRMANSLALRRMTNAFGVMERMRHLVSGRGLIQNPLVVSLCKQEARENPTGCE
jgi:hypothetical protein